MTDTPAPPATHDADTLVVRDKRLIAEDVVALVLGRPDGGRLPDWTPGAHIDLVLPDGSTRQYSLAGDPSDAATYRLGVLREADGLGSSRYIHDTLQVGDLVRFGGPRNTFRLAPAPAYDFVAGGIGITPILPMLRAATALGADWRLLYLGRSRRSMAFADELPDGGEVRLHPSDDLGRAALDDWLSASHPGVKLYACGPGRLLDHIRSATVDRRRGWVRIERFAAPDAGIPARTAPFDVEVDGTGRVIRVDPGVAVADALRDAGFDLLTSCARGVCGTCETRVLSGTPDHRDAVLDEQERDDAGCFFPCVSRARSDRLVVAL